MGKGSVDECGHFGWRCHAGMSNYRRLSRCSARLKVAQKRRSHITMTTRETTADGIDDRLGRMFQDLARYFFWIEVGDEVGEVGSERYHLIRAGILR